jgi:hypothetical protein
MWMWVNLRAKINAPVGKMEWPLSDGSIGK